MSWGGGGGGFGGLGGLGGPGVGGRPEQPQGLPFAGVPPELAELAQKLIEREPEENNERREVAFAHATDATERPFTVRSLLAPRALAIAVVFALVLVETVLLQLGPRLAQLAIDRGVLVGDFGVVMTLALVYLASVVGGALVTAGRTAWAGRVGEDLLYRLRCRIFSHIQRLSMDYFTEEKAGRIMTRVTSDVEALQVLFQQGFVNMLLQIGTLVFVVTQLFAMNTELATWVTVGIVPPLAVFTLWFRSASDWGYLSVREWIGSVLAHLQENLAGVRVVAAHNRQERNANEHRALVGDYRAANVYTAHIAGIYMPATVALGTLSQAFVLLVGGRMVVDGRLTIGQLTAFVLYLNAFFQPIQQLVQLYTTYQQGRAAVVKLRQLFSTRPTVRERPDAYELPPIEGEIAFEGVSFGYVADRPVLDDVDLRIERGETFAFVGPTGAGKSTIVKLVTRFYDPTAGHVLVDGHDIRDVTLPSLRRQIGVVPQEPFLFAGTVAENIEFGKPGVTRDEILEACAAVGIAPLIGMLPDGIDTECHERGVTLSSGERQLIALARAFLASPRVLILDEATSNLDLATERLVERALDVLLEGRTAILIAHRLNTAMRADRIGVVDGGRLVELGHHADLLAQGGRYAAMFEAWRQSRNGEPVP